MEFYKRLPQLVFFSFDFDPQSRTTQKARVTLMLIKDNYHAWALGRAPGLIKQYQEAIDLLKED